MNEPLVKDEVNINQNQLGKNGLTAQARSAFIVKVYLLLVLQLTITFGACLLSQFYQPYRVFQLRYKWVLVFPCVLLILSMVVAFCNPKARKFPLNMLLLLAFIASFSYLISFACSSVLEQMSEPIVAIALAITILIVAVITLYAICCQANFLVLLGILLIVGVTSVFVALISVFSFAPTLINVYCGLCAVAYGIYLVILTKMVIADQIAGFPLDSAIIASLSLYLVIIKMFQLILRILANK